MGSPVPTSDFISDDLVVSKCYSTSGRSCQQRVIIWSLQPFARTKQVDAIKLCWQQRKQSTFTYWIVQGIHRHLHFSCCIQRENLGIFGRVPDHRLFAKYFPIYPYNICICLYSSCIAGSNFRRPIPSKGTTFSMDRCKLQKMGPDGICLKNLYLCGRQSTLNFNHWIRGGCKWCGLYFGANPPSNSGK